MRDFLYITMKKLFLFILILCASVHALAVGWTPTDAGLVVNLGQGDRFLLSIMVDHDNNPATPAREYFVANYTRYKGDDYFKYKFDEKDSTQGHWLKLIQQPSTATEPAEMIIWEVGAPLVRQSGGKNYDLGGIAYTIWNDGKTLRTNNTNYQFMGDLTGDYNYKDACDVVFVIPTVRGVPTVQDRTLPSFDPKGTLGRGTAPFDGATGSGFMGMTYREVYMFDIPRLNPPITYTNASLVTFNTTTKQKSWSNGQIKCDPGKAAYAFADSKHDATTRVVFRLYLLDKPFVSCPKTYFFATDEQDYIRYRKTENVNGTAADSTTAKKIYTMDYLTPMNRVGATTTHRTGWMKVPVPDSTYYYVGWKDDYYAANKDKTSARMGDNPGTPALEGAYSQFTKIRELPMKTLSGFYAPAGAYGRMVIDSTSTADNHGVKFEPKGYMLKVSTGKNVRMRPNADSTVWTTQDMWTIDESWEGHTIKATLMTGPEFSDTDPGADITGWSVNVAGSAVPVYDQPEATPAGKSGYAQITVTDANPNGSMTFIEVSKARHLHYSNNGFLGDTVPDQYPITGTTVTIQAPRIKADYKFLGWSKNKNGSGDTIHVGDPYTIKTTADTLYALATYEGTLQVAISFIGKDGKRYYLNHPGAMAPRYSRARHYANWETTWQGMANAENNDPNYVSTFELRHPSNEINRKDVGVADLREQEKVLDPRRYTMRGYEDSLTFYEYFSPTRDEYLGLYYQAPNVILANNTWAGLFETNSDATTTGWPDYMTPYISGVKLKSTRYVEEYDATKPDSLILKERSNKGAPWVQYDPATDQFNGVELEKDATVFDISAVIVADAHYVVIPDTSEVWRDTIEFAYHKNEQKVEKAWSKLIGKQFMAVMVAGSDTVYFHPNRKKIINDPNNLYLSPDFRVSQYFSLIRDSRISSSTPLSASDSVMRQETPDYWCNEIVSGLNSPMDIRDKAGNPIDIVDTLRIDLSHGGISKIKEYRGRWKKGAPGLHMVNADGSARYRDVIIRTKTYHYGAQSTHLVLRPEKESYSFGPLVGQSQTIKFYLTREHRRKLMDIKGQEVDEVVTRIDTIRTGWSIPKANCSCPKDHSFEIPSASDSLVTIRVKDENTSGVNYDTLVVAPFTVSDTTVSVRVPLVQAALQGTELIWSVVDGGKRYFITASKGGTEDKDKFIFRQYSQSGTTLYLLNSKNVPLIKGAADAGNGDGRYITPWQYIDKGSNQIALKTVLHEGDTLHFKVDGTPKVSRTDSTLLTYKFVNTYVNDNANYEEQVKLHYGSGENDWLKYSNGAFSFDTETNASVFSWSYLQQEYSLLNNGTYPSQDEAEFGYNTAAPATIQTRYKAYKEYTMLLDNKQVDLCRSEETNLTTLANAEWGLSATITRTADTRTFASGSTPSPAVSSLGLSTDGSTLVTTITPATATSPRDVKIGGEYVNIVDTMVVSLSSPAGHSYHMKGDWSGYSRISDANLKIPLVRKTYHETEYDSLACVVGRGINAHTFPAALTTAGKDKNDTVVFRLSTLHRTGRQVVDVDNIVEDVVSAAESYVNTSGGVHINNKNLAEVRLVDEYGNTPDWCRIEALGDSTIEVKCLLPGIRAPRSAYIYVAYIAYVDDDGDDKTPKVMRFVNTRLTVSQASQFENVSNQVLDHSAGASGDAPAANGLQQVHENRRILYYYPDEDVELPVRERGFYGWWRWYRESNDPTKVESDIPDSVWRKPPQNIGKYNFPFRTIGDTVWVDPADHTKGKKQITQGRYTVFHYPARDDGNARKDPPSKNPRIAPPSTAFNSTGKYKCDTIAVDISNYYDNLPFSVTHKNQIDTAMLDTMRHIPEPTLSLREVFELHPWTEMADTLWNYKSEIPEEGATLDDKEYPLADEKYMEDHVMMAPLGNRLLLQTEQRYNNKNLEDMGFSDSQLGYFMHDDNWEKGGWTQVQKDSMIWLGGWDADCEWFTYDTKTHKYSPCSYTLTKENDFLSVPAKTTLSTGHEFDTVYYCLRARSKASTWDGEEKKYVTVAGNNWYNICRYKIIYHNPNKYGPLEEKTVQGEDKALITNKEIEQRYEVLERLNFDYIKPGTNYHVYPHPLPWADASYGYCYPETPDLPHNRLHTQSDFPNFGEYGLVNKIPYSDYWNMMEQHGGAANGYMIYCDGMASAGQVAALSLETKLCEGQKMFFSAYVCNPSSQKNKANPNFTFSVQGLKNGVGQKWEDITSYMTGDILPSRKWSQICFPIMQEHDYDQFRIRIYNMSSDFDGNDFIIDDMCIFATKPPLIAYQASTACVDEADNDSTTNVIIRVDYKGITGEDLNGVPVYYTIEAAKGGDTTFIAPIDGYFYQDTLKAPVVVPAKPDTIYGYVTMPLKEYNPPTDSIYTRVSDLLAALDESAKDNPKSPSVWIRSGYVTEYLEGAYRPVLYFVHKAKMATDTHYKVHMTNAPQDLMNSQCALTSDLKVNNRMLLEINGEEQPEMTIVGMCANATYNLSLRIKSSVYEEGVAPMDVNGSCINDWLLYGDTADVSSLKRYGYKYSDIKTMVTDILRYETTIGKNQNQFASSLAAVSRDEMVRVQRNESHAELSDGVDAYEMLVDLVNKGFLVLYKKQITVTVNAGDSVEYVILPIEGTGSEAMSENNMEVCPYPLYIKLTPDKSVGTIPLIIGGLHRDSTEASLPVTTLLNEQMANGGIALRIDSIQNMTAIHSIVFHSTDDPDFIEGVHSLTLRPDRIWHLDGQSNDGYYQKGDTMILYPATSQTYTMKAGHNYTFTINMMSHTGSLTDGDCKIGEIPFTVGVVPGYMRWDPKNNENNQWTYADNWMAVDEHDVPVEGAARFAPMGDTHVIIPKMTDGKPYPVVPPMPTVWKDSIQKVNFQYDTCHAIRFRAGAAIGQQQHMAYTNAVVDMEMPQQKWALRGAPIQGMISGDIYMGNADLSNETPLWEVGEFDVDGRNYRTGNASFWLSVYSRDTKHVVQTGDDEERRATQADWSKVTNGMTLSLAPAQGFAIYARTKAGSDAVVRLPKNDDIYYYYGTYGERLDYKKEDTLRTQRAKLAGGADKVGKLAYKPTSGSQTYRISNDNGVKTNSFVFGNPTMGYIDIWGFIDDNCLKEEFDYLDASGTHHTISRAVAMASDNVISEPMRYLPPQYAMVVKLAGEAQSASLDLALYTNRVVTETSQAVPSTHACGTTGGDQALAQAPQRRGLQKGKGIMVVTAINPVSPRCNSRLLLGQGYDRAIRSGEDAVLTTFNIDNFHMTNTPTTPFNIYAIEDSCGLSINLLDSIVNVPISFYMSDLPYEPTTQLWFTGVNSIDGQLVLYDALLGTERTIIDGICLTIETPDQNHQKRYYIRRRGFNPDDAEPGDTPTGYEPIEREVEQAYKIIDHNHVYIIRGGHVYTVTGQKVR